MSKKSLLLVCILFGFLPLVKGQAVHLYRDTSIQVIDGAMQFKNAWAGGFNSPVFTDIDLNGDGKMDIAVLDAQSYRLSTFINDGTASKVDYVYAPEYQKLFPPNLEGWIRTYDYDNDGDMDLFSYTNAGIDVFRNDYTSLNGLHFTLISNQLTTHYGSFATNIYVSRVNMPALIDDDGDGDMDVLSFSLSGNFVERQENLSMDSLGVINQFLFYNVNGCWGYFGLSNNANVGVLANSTTGTNGCDTTLPASPFRVDSQARHSGSTLLLLDMDGDGDKDVLNGDILSPNLLYLQNCGTADSAYMCVQDSVFPSYAAVDGTMNSVASPYYFDANNDGNKDLIVANFYNTGEDYNNVKYYRNTTNNTTNIFSYVTNRFMVDNMIEVGTGAHPVVMDVDGDGLKDLLISSDYTFNPGKSIGAIKYYRNIGTATAPKFAFVTNDFAGLAADSLRAIYLSFGDLDNDGDKDMVVGVEDGTLIYFTNNGGAYTLTQANYQLIDVGDVAVPQLIDLDRDGLLDLVIGKRNGKISYYKNTGTLTAPAFTFVTDTLGGVTVRRYNSYAGYSVPLVFDHNGVYEMLVGSYSGYLSHYTNIDGNLTGNFTLTDSMYQNIYEPENATPAMADLDGDGKYDLVVGNLAGGLVYYSQNSILSVKELNTSEMLLTLYPNPANDLLTIKTGNLGVNAKAKAVITDVLGRQLKSMESLQEMMQIDIQDLTPGIYLCTITIGQRSFSRQFVKQ